MGLLLGDIRVCDCHKHGRRQRRLSSLDRSSLHAVGTCMPWAPCVLNDALHTSMLWQGPPDRAVAHVWRVVPQIRTDRRKVSALHPQHGK